MVRARRDRHPLLLLGVELHEVAQLAEADARPAGRRRDQHHGVGVALYRAVAVRLARARQVRALREDVRAQYLFELLRDAGELRAAQAYQRAGGAAIWRHDIDQVAVRFFRHRLERCRVGNAEHPALARQVYDVAPVGARLL